jgi:hypothetical protein
MTSQTSNVGPFPWLNSKNGQSSGLGVGQRLPNARELATSRMTVRTVDGCQPLAQDLVGTARLTSLPDTISSSHRSVPNKFQHISRRHRVPYVTGALLFVDGGMTAL